ncbi:MAG: hypothetical protein IID46_05800, partial [Planctomycetes bacterium]|nr:hypothetical protein [Planctomycetota bacterium]
LKGVESSAAQYVLQGKDIGGEIAKAITAKLKELRDKHDALPELPAGFYPEWRPTPDFNFLKKYKVEQLTSVHGLCFHNETFWRINAVENVDETMTSIHKQLQDNGWAGELNEMDRAGPVHLRMSKDSQVLEVFSESWMHRKLNKTDAPRSIDLFVRYRDPMTTDEYHDVFEELLTSQEPDDNLLLKMRRYGSSDQRRRVIELIEENPPHTAFAWIALANHYHAKNDRQATIDALRAAHHLTYAMTDYSAVQNEIRRLTKKLELSVDDIQTIDPSVFKRLGMPVLEYGSGPQVQEIGTGETAAFFARDNSGQWKVASVTLHRKYQQGSQTLYDFTVMESGPDNSRSWSRSSQNLQRPYRSTKHVGNQQVTLEIDRTQDGLIRVTAGTEETPSQDVPAKQF